MQKFVAACALTALSQLVPAQGPSVLDLQKSYHVGIYSASIDVPSGATMLLAQHGTLDLTSAGLLTGALDTWEWTVAGGTFTPNDPLAGEYRVAPNGIIEFDFDPQNPGTDTFAAFIVPDGATIHVGRYEADTEALSVLMTEKSTGQSNASLSGTYHFYQQFYELAGTSFDTAAGRGTATFDGAGGFTATGVEDSWAASGAMSSQTFNSSGAYAVAADGALVLDGSPGGISSNGDLLFVVTGSATHSEVGLTIGVRVGSSYDHGDLTGRYSVHGLELDVASSPGAPRTVTDIGELDLTALSPTAGGWAFAGVVVDGTAQGVVSSPVSAAGTTALAANGVMTLSDPAPALELAFSASGDYATGRIFESYTSLFFAARACPCEAYGTGTAGTGGVEPELGMRTFPTLGNAGWKFAIVGGRGGAAAIMPIGFAGVTTGIPLSGGLLWLDPLQIVANPFVVLGGAAGAAGAGELDIPLPIPTDPSFAGVTLFAQALVLDPNAPANVAMSRGFEVVFCR